MTLEKLTTQDNESHLERLREVTAKILKGVRLATGGVRPEDWPASSSKNEEGRLAPKLGDVPEHTHV